MADAVQTSIPSTEAAAPVAAAPAAAPAEPAKAEPAIDYAAQLKALEKIHAKQAKELEAIKAKASEADDIKARLADALGLGKKEDPAAAAEALRQRLAQLETQVARNVLRESVRSSGVTFADGVDPDDVLAFLGSIEVDVTAGAIKDASDFKARMDALLERKPFLRAPAAPAARGVPAPAPSAAPPTAPVKQAAPRKIDLSSARSIFFGQG